jgi:hypothetical protein
MTFPKELKSYTLEGEPTKQIEANFQMNMYV